VRSGGERYTIHREWNHKSTTNEYKDYDIVYVQSHDTGYEVVYCTNNIYRTSSWLGEINWENAMLFN
jgi:hypothetical protein